MKVFLAMPYSQLCDKKYELKEEYKTFFVKLTEELKKINCDYFLAHEREKWGKKYSSAEESTAIDYDTIRAVDLVCVIPGIPSSGGVHVEIGWASANKKPLKIFLKKNHMYSPMVTGIHCLTHADYIYYEKEYSGELIDLIIDEIKDYF
ncbi:MAG: hypothetical protein K6F59_05130, partial [Gammaproteobacteria bacterium]|nr:hypothetical protein [Gammaproteobacteria bacterium]